MATAVEILLLRHAEAETAARLCGRTDAPLTQAGQAAAAGLRPGLAGLARRVVSPALRCRQTAEALWPGAALATDARLLEQDFGAWEGRPLAALPDLGPLSPEALAAHRPPGGESFADLCARVGPALDALAAGPGPVGVVAHAGTVRAALARAIGAPGPALAFEIAPLGLTRLVWHAGGISVACVNAPADAAA